MNGIKMHTHHSDRQALVAPTDASVPRGLGMCFFFV